MKIKNWILADQITLGDLVFSPRTKQLMLILEINKDKFPNLKVSWLPLGNNLLCNNFKQMRTEISSSNKYIKIQSCQKNTEK
jgi:hypothetical protein